MNSDACNTQKISAHLLATVDWLKLAQDTQSDGGVSAGYTMFKGWSASFPETTGYIVPTFLNFQIYSKDPEYGHRALSMAEWLTHIQNPDGSFSAGIITSKEGPSVFNTGQIIFGLVRIHQITEKDDYIESAIKAGHWLVSAQSKNGEWAQFDYFNKPHVYNTRTSWALLVLYNHTKIVIFREAALRNIEWMLSHVDPNGFFDQCAFDPLRPGQKYTIMRKIKSILHDKNYPSFFTKSSLHTIAYTIQGLLESSWILDHVVGERCALKAAEILAEHILQGNIAGYYGPGWEKESSSICLTGTAQMAVVWMRLYEKGYQHYLSPASRAVEILMESQQITTRRRELQGAVAGSSPIYGLYLPFRYPNWAAKFAVDAYLFLLLIQTDPSLLQLMKFW